MSEFWKRTLSGAVFVGCIVGSILWNEWAFAGLLLLICLLAVDEFHRLVQSHTVFRVCSALATFVLWGTFVGMAYNPLGGEFYRAFGITGAMIYLPIILIALLDEVWNLSGKPMQNWGNMLISQLMIALPLCMMCFLMSLSKWLLLALFILIWVNDTGAYCVGSLTAKRPNGNHKMAPHISPKKSWEGLFGGIAFAFLAAIILFFCGWFDEISASGFGLVVALGFAFIASAFGTFGDLMESLFKRSIGVKDSGRFLPGHGGVLDRFDSILMAAPLITSYSWLCYFIVPLF